MIDTQIFTLQISNPASAILDRESRMTVQIEWIETHLLYDDRYNRLDEVDSRHKYQMAYVCLIYKIKSENQMLHVLIIKLGISWGMG